MAVGIDLLEIERLERGRARRRARRDRAPVAHPHRPRCGRDRPARMTLPAWLEPLPDAAQQRDLDRWVIEELAIVSLELMERAGAGLARLVAERAPAGR